MARQSSGLSAQAESFQLIIAFKVRENNGYLPCLLILNLNFVDSYKTAAHFFR
jgi:hypothetical protein